MTGNKTKLWQMMSVIAFSSFCSISSADFYADNNLQRPRAGETVCRAMVDEFGLGNPFNRYDICENDCQQVVLPAALCSRHSAIDGSFGWGRKLRVASIGDFFILQDDSDIPRTSTAMIAENSAEVCNARVVDPETEEVRTVRRLEAGLCFAGAEFVYLDGEETRQGRVEVAFDFYLVESEEVQVAHSLDLVPAHGTPDRVLPANYSSDQAIEI